MSQIISRINGFQPYLSSHVLLYHSLSAVVPPALAVGLHNVTPEVFRQQLRWLKRHFTFVTLEEYCANSNNGCVAITFDDGYLSVFSEALSVLEDLSVPATVFLCGVTFTDSIFWRDRVRILMNLDLVEEFLSVSSAALGSELTCRLRSNFYTASKDPSVNSRRIDFALRQFFAEKRILEDHYRFCAYEASQLPRHPLIRYGSHSYNHYVLSSLSPDEQELEIRRNIDFLHNLDVEQSEIFSIPFGGDRDFNQTTLELLRQYRYRGVLYSRNRLNFSSSRGQLCHIERYMVSSTYDGFQKQMLRLFLGLSSTV